MECRCHSSSTANNTSQCNRDGASTLRGCRRASMSSGHGSSRMCRKAAQCGCLHWIESTHGRPGDGRSSADTSNYVAFGRNGDKALQRISAPIASCGDLDGHLEQMRSICSNEHWLSEAKAEL